MGINRMALDFMAQLGAMVIVTVLFIMAIPVLFFLLVLIVFFGDKKHKFES